MPIFYKLVNGNYAKNTWTTLLVSLINTFSFTTVIFLIEQFGYVSYF
jgi:hypothetical protein